MEYKTIRETAEALGVKVRTVRSWLSSGKMQAVKRGRAWMIPVDEIKRLSDQKYNDFFVKVDVDGRPTAHVKSDTAVDVTFSVKNGTKMQDAVKIQCRTLNSGSCIAVLNAQGDIIANIIL